MKILCPVKVAAHFNSGDHVIRPIQRAMIAYDGSASAIRPGVETDDIIGSGSHTDHTDTYSMGCTECHDTGYSGRCGIYEVLPVANDLKEIITHDSSAGAIRRWHREHGGKTLLDGGIRLAEQGVTSLEEVARVAFVD